MTKSIQKPSLLNLSVEEENLAAIPFAVLERRVGKKVGRIEIQGSKVFPDGTEVQVSWQIQGNDQLGLPTEQDLDIFVALGVLTFRSNFSKTVSFTGREIARILNISSVHGKFYQRLKMAMDRFIPLRFRALAASDHQEDVKWCNVFQEASFSLDRTTGRCTGAITWTDKLIQSMDSGFFRAIDAGRYMELDGITAKHLYRFLVLAFEKADLVIVDARKLATNHLGILTPPKYFSRLMQTLEPAFDQLIRIKVVGSYHVVSADEWRIALRRHNEYVPERKTLLLENTADPESSRQQCRRALEKAGLPAAAAENFSGPARTRAGFYALERAANLLQWLQEEDVQPHVAISLVRRALELGAMDGEGRELLDWCEIAVEVCQQKKRAGQVLKNSAGLLVKIVKDPETRRKVISPDLEANCRRRFRQREQAVLQQEAEAEVRGLICEFEQFRRLCAENAFQELSDARKHALRKEKTALLQEQGRLAKLPPEVREREIDELVLQDLAKSEAPPFEKWRLRKKAQQAVLPFQPAADGCRAV